MFILLPVTWLIVGFSNFSSKAIVPRWSIVVNPVILTIILSIVTWIIPKTECLLPGIFSLGITLYYIICWISLKKDRNLCLKESFSNWWHRDCDNSTDFTCYIYHDICELLPWHTSRGIHKISEKKVKFIKMDIHDTQNIESVLNNLIL